MASNFVFRLGGIVSLCLSLLGQVSGSQEAFSRYALVRVDGMSCYVCLYSIEKSCKIQRLGNGATIDLKRGLTKIKLAKGELVPEPGKFERLVLDSGFTFVWVELELMGRILQEDGRYLVIVNDPLQRIPVEISQDLKAQDLGEGMLRLKLRAEGKKPRTWSLILAQAPSGEGMP